jgi:predicted phage terminase large subunit-like protein
VAAAWNAANVSVPRTGDWVDAFTSEVVAFTGINDRHDDQVDALSSAFSAMTNATHVIRTKPRAQGYRLGASRGF